jgi:hypothetical protein
VCELPRVSANGGRLRRRADGFWFRFGDSGGRNLGGIFAPELRERERERELVWVITVLPAVSAQLGPLIEDFSAQNYKLVWQRWAKSLRGRLVSIICV